MEIKNYSINEDSASMDMSDMFTGVGQITADINESDDVPYLLSRDITVADVSGVEYTGMVRQIASNNEDVSLTADSILRRFNVDKYVDPTRNFDADRSALDYTVGMLGDYAGVPVDFRYKESDNATWIIFFPGGMVNLWDELKELAAIYKFDFWVEENTLVVDNLNTEYIQPTRIIDSDWGIDINDVANWVDVKYYHNPTWFTGDYGNPLEEDLEYYPRGSNDEAQVLQVDANETEEIELDVNAWVYVVNQPECVEWVDNKVHDETQGVYSVIGNDNLPIMPGQWLDSGGVLKVETTDDPSIIKVILTGADIPELAPFQIAMSSGNHYNSLHLTGWSYIWQEKTVRVYTGAGSELTSQEQGAEIDSRHIHTIDQAFDVAARVARSYAGPNFVANATLLDDVRPGQIINGVDAKFRVAKVSRTPENNAVEAYEASTFADFNEVWSESDTFADFNTEFGGMIFQDFATAPLRRKNG